ncbi:hypothetical protein ILUMI_04910 [Ignelater luminosus]|uniref:CMP-sialic acid transporter n=1 Tax=Ignelater luminosus TaxID=2038154 RepID=A0A8K0GKN2_IGNLU|nr:hypothetical protein ILUMI_04910 [Ignelater luminosus]
MVNFNWSELFPNKCSIIIFILYIVLFVNQGILVTASQDSNNLYNYDIITVVLLTEVLKLITSVSLYCRDHSFASLFEDAWKNKNVLGLYFVPAFLYSLYNNLSFINLVTFDPTTYYLLLQFRVVITAVLFEVIFKKKLSRKQWWSLLILTVGCMFKQVNFSLFFDTKENTTKSVKSTNFVWDINALFILIQASCSCLAGVYNEYLLKEPGANVHIFIQNVFMYLDSILCNCFLLVLQGNFQAFSLTNIQKVFHYKVIMVMLNNTAIGIITSFFLKNMNSILKTYASALELIFTAIFSYLLFSIPIHLNTILAIVTVLYAMFLYTQNPVSNPAVNKGVRSNEDEEELLMEEV